MICFERDMNRISHPFESSFYTSCPSTDILGGAVNPVHTRNCNWVFLFLLKNI